MPAEDVVIAALRARGADTLEHPGGVLLDHLVRVSERLRSWGAPAAVVLAGLAHAAYGTDGFAAALFDRGERDRLAELIGRDGERLVHLYASSDRSRSYVAITSGASELHDRFTGSVLAVSEEDLRAFVELTVANEVDVVRHSDRLRALHGDGLRALFEQWRPLLSPAAVDDCLAVLGGDAGPLAHRHVVVDGTRIHCLDWGAPGSPTAVFLHGGGLNAHTWDRVCAVLSDRYRCIAVDLRGHGESEWSPTLDYLPDAHARDLRGVLEQLDLERPVVIGHSLGGFAALHLASWYSEKLAGIVVVDTSPFVADHPTLAKIRTFAQGRDTFDTFDDAIDHALGFSPDRRRAQMRATLRHSLRQLRDGRWTWRHDRRHLDDEYFDATIAAAHALVPAIGDISCPALIVRGEHGLGTHDTERFVRLLREARCTTIPGAGHNLQSENPVGLLEALEPFIDVAFAAA